MSIGGNIRWEEGTGMPLEADDEEPDEEENGKCC
jgi:hypothetical protein